MRLVDVIFAVLVIAALCGLILWCGGCASGKAVVKDNTASSTITVEDPSAVRIDPKGSKSANWGLNNLWDGTVQITSQGAVAMLIYGLVKDLFWGTGICFCVWWLFPRKKKR